MAAIPHSLALLMDSWVFHLSLFIFIVVIFSNHQYFGEHLQILDNLDHLLSFSLAYP